MAVRVGSRPVAFRNPMTFPSNADSWSSSMKRCGPSPGNTSRSCWTTHAGVGSRVTLTCRIMRRRCSMTKKHESSWKVNVGTVKKSQATIASRWLARKADQRLAGSPRRGTRRRYRATLRSETAKPSFKSSPWILGAPQSAFSAAKLAFEHGDLLSEREDLQGGIAATAQEHAECCQD